MKPSPDFDLTGLIAAMEAIAAQGSDDGGGVTTRELRNALGWGRDRVLDYLHELVQRGELEIVPRRITTLNGRTQTTLAYRLKK